MKTYFMTLLNGLIFLAIFILIPYIVGNWGALLISWIPAAFVWQTLDDAMDNANKTNNPK